jgi:hypothetical protein
MLEASLAALNQEHVDILVRDIPQLFVDDSADGSCTFNDRTNSSEHDYKTRSSKASSYDTSSCAYAFYL